MAADKQTFSHITVNAGDEDDFVIVAGIPSRDAGAAEAVAAEGEGGAAAHDRAGERFDERQDDAEDAGTPVEAVSAGAAQPRDGYHETTLEDLQSASMSVTQKAVIAVAALVLVAAIGYYFVFMA